MVPYQWIIWKCLLCHSYQHQKAPISYCVHNNPKKAVELSVYMRSVICFGFSVFGHDPGKTKLKPVSVEGDVGRRKHHQKCFLIIRVHMTVCVARWEDTDIHTYCYGVCVCVCDIYVWVVLGVLDNSFKALLSFSYKFYIP
jgi:hypothetical protein